MPIVVKIGKGETIEKALRRLKRKLDNEGIIRNVRARRYYEKPCQVRRRKRKAAAFSSMLRQRNENA